jgi:hypothetical protein
MDMTRIALFFAGLGAATLLSAAPAFAQAAFVASNGNDANDCSRATPCATFSRALTRVKPNQTVLCLDSGPFVGHTIITQPVTIDCAGGVAAPGVVFPVQTAFTIDGASGAVVLRNIVINSNDHGSAGVEFLNGSALTLDNVKIFGFNGGVALGGAQGNAGLGMGIRFAPQSGSAKLHVLDSVVEGNGLASSGGGIVIQPAGAGTARVTMERVAVKNNTAGVFANGNGSTGAIVVQMRDCAVAESTLQGITAFTQPGAAVTSVTVDHSSSVLNAFGVLAQGQGAFVFLSDTTVMSNTTGLGLISAGTIFSYGNNRLTGNAGDGAAPTPVALR